MRRFDQPLAAAFRKARRTVPARPASSGRLVLIDDVSNNPGDLRGYAHVPRDLPRRAPLVVVLYGCTQDAASYDRGSGWSALAHEQGFALLYPEQQRGNNPNNCFNWFRPGDARRGRGEAASIRQMVAAMVAAHGLDEARIFVTGLSAGGAMTSIMMAAYPDVFAGRAVIVGLPFAVANSVPEALAKKCAVRGRLTGMRWVRWSPRRRRMTGRGRGCRCGTAPPTRPSAPIMARRWSSSGVGFTAQWRATARPLTAIAAMCGATPPGAR